MAMDTEKFHELLRDIEAETADLVSILLEMDAADWQRATPATGWNVHDQVVHLAYFDQIAALGFSDPARFHLELTRLLATGETWVDQVNVVHKTMPPAETLDWLETNRAAMISAYAEAGPGARSEWFGPAMSAASSATARLMETWAHGQDIYDALGVRHPLSDRVRHVCHLGVITRGFTFALRGLAAPTEEVRVELVAPNGEIWAWGPADCANRVTAPAEDFALVVTQRRHRTDTKLQATAGAADDWMNIAQAFAGTAASGREPGQFGQPGRVASGPVSKQGVFND